MWLLLIGPVFFAAMVGSIYLGKEHIGSFRYYSSILLFAMILLMFFWMCVGDPGLALLEDSSSRIRAFFESDDPEKAAQGGGLSGQGEERCEKCRVLRTLEVKHCAVCDTCVREIDHHCVIFGKCVAKKNLLVFRLMLGTLIVVLMSTYVMGFQLMRAELKDRFKPTE